jgi:catechol 2,3-dioxygenase-like lactoylglutathione lyase family enzyme
MKFVHTNIVARDWRALARFYVDVFGCEILLPERDLKGEWLDRLTGLTDTHILGAHLRLPGYEDGEGPTLEVFQYGAEVPAGMSAINKPGFAHIAFSVEDVRACVDEIRAHGGTLLGEIVEAKVGERLLTVAYTRDIEGNLVEVQRCEKG